MQFFSALWEIIRGILLTIIIIILCVTAVGAIAWQGIGAGSNQIRVPKVVGMSLSDAQQTLEQSGLKFKTVGKEYSNEVGPDRIMNCRPFEDMLVKSNRVVECTISLGPKSVVMPDVTDIAMQAAEAKLQRAGLRVKDLRRVASEKPVDQVIKQTPTAGKKLDRQDGALLEVSGGPDYGTFEIAGQQAWIFRQINVTVPKGQPLQRVEVYSIASEGKQKTVYDRVHRPADEVSVNVTGHKGWRVKVNISGKQVYEGKL